MKFCSPLRYPGGKNKLSKFIALICKENDVNGHYIEPYAGGASVALHLLFNGYVEKVTINDYDRAIYAFWYSALNDTDGFCRKIKNTEISVESWKKQKKVQKDKDNEKDLLKLGFSTFFLNRTNYSGIIDGGIIGGISQNGKYKINSRFNKEELISRIRLVATYKKNIHLENMDALDLVKKIKKDKNTIFYFDPPYYLKGHSLYMNHYSHEDHEGVSSEIKKIKNSRWIISYDNISEVKDLYKGFKKIEYSIFHQAHRPKEGKEVLFFDKSLFIPRVQNPAKV
ncbi:DNA adenine methylase [Patescibacteria group bacterium]|nr:DNA adenine methylase [Patescibacteria group bacterium]